VAGAGNESSVKWKNVGAAIEKCVVWDAVYYIRIAECGYEYEQTHAFFPALPLLTRFLANNCKIYLFCSHGWILYCYPDIFQWFESFLVSAVDSRASLPLPK
jgi:hypothetical protein